MDADRVAAAAEKEVADMAIAYPSGSEPPEATADPTATHTSPHTTTTLHQP